MKTKLEEANKLFKEGKYEQALSRYQKLPNAAHNYIYDINIDICKREIIEKEKIKVDHAKLSGVNIAFITDANYLMATYIAMHSIVSKRNTDYNYNIYLFLVDLDKAEAEAFNKLKRKNLKIFIMEYSECTKEFAIKKEGFHVSTAAVVKFQLSEILKDCDRVLYLDGDIIVQGDLVDFYNKSLENVYGAVVEDIKPKLKYKPSILKKLDIEKHDAYFNSGVMLLNLSKLREEKVADKLFEYRRSGINFFMDQDALNVVFRSKLNFLPIRYNFLTTLSSVFDIREINREYGIRYHYNSFDEALNDAEVIHYASKNKPWKGAKDIYTETWLKHFIASKAYERFPAIHQVQHDFLSSEYIVSLTSYPARIKSVHFTIESILSQSFKADKVVLWLASEQFPNKENDLPSNLVCLKEKGLYIKWCEDIRSYKKLIPALRDYPDAVIVTADDDLIYEKNWLSNIVASYLQEPKSIHCYRAHEVTFDSFGRIVKYNSWRKNIQNKISSPTNFFTGCGGVLYPPRILHKDVFKKEAYYELCQHGDDIWFWGMAVINDVKIKIVKGKKFKLNFVPESQDVALWHENDVNGRNDVMINNLLLTYPDIVSKIKGDEREVI
ncbi:glycosyltransferase family 8 protein [Halomonas dongshanensis]|uniref:Glycosyltransferase family 8 protein n=1 Tax=Halomonas dongshanensis TaxID=2890835 RepID=A0ABT2EET8_9GAMM|nr:glycosyltransferase family 8 protein [Halomonas dongshanensis]MCS2609142.1 glycosyltransferase family 8 protein [Halomonas dongshanensis]